MDRDTLRRMHPMVTLLDEPYAGLVDRVTGLINDVYAVAEAGLWQDGRRRTLPNEIAELIAAREIAAANLNGGLVGVVRVHAVSDDTGEFGMLAADPKHRGVGVGRALVDFAERHCRDQRMRAMQLELLVPLTWRHPSKVFLDEWYRRLGYRVTRTAKAEDSHPQLAPYLATPCEIRIYEKALTTSSGPGGGRRARPP